MQLILWSKASTQTKHGLTLRRPAFLKCRWVERDCKPWWYIPLYRNEMQIPTQLLFGRYQTVVLLTPPHWQNYEERRRIEEKQRFPIIAIKRFLENFTKTYKLMQGTPKALTSLASQKNLPLGGWMSEKSEAGIKGIKLPVSTDTRARNECLLLSAGGLICNINFI